MLKEMSVALAGFSVAENQAHERECRGEEVETVASSEEDEFSSRRRFTQSMSSSVLITSWIRVHLAICWILCI